MISDSLSECIEAIDGYMQRFPEAYASFKPRLHRLRAEMNEMRAILDTPPVGDGLPDLIAWPNDRRIRLFPTTDAGLRALAAEPLFGRYGAVVLTHYGVDANCEHVARLCKWLRVGQCSGDQVATTLAAVAAWREGGRQDWLPY